MRACDTSASSLQARLIESISSAPGVLITTYSSLVLHQEMLMRCRWLYLILDEGHKIKNPNAKVTQCAKKVRSI